MIIGKDGLEPNQEFAISIGGETCVARQYQGVGTLNLSTSRGELKVTSGDVICAFGGETLVMSEDLFLKMVEDDAANSLDTPVQQDQEPIVAPKEKTIQELRLANELGETLTPAELARLQAGV